MKTPLGTEADLRAGHIVLDAFPALRERGTAPPPLLGPCLLWPRSPISATAELLLKDVKNNTTEMWNLKSVIFCLEPNIPKAFCLYHIVSLKKGQNIFVDYKFPSKPFSRHNNRGVVNGASHVPFLHSTWRTSATDTSRRLAAQSGSERSSSPGNLQRQHVIRRGTENPINNYCRKKADKYFTR